MLKGGLTLLGKRGGAPHGGDEVRVSQAAATAGGHDHALPGLSKIGELAHGLLGLGVELADDRAKGDLKDKVGTVGAVTFGALAMGAALGAEVVLVAIIDERRELCVGNHHDVAAVAAVAAVGAALGDKRLAPEGHAARPAVAALDIDMREIGESIFHVRLQSRASLLPAKEYSQIKTGTPRKQGPRKEQSKSGFTPRGREPCA